MKSVIFYEISHFLFVMKQCAAKVNLNGSRAKPHSYFYYIYELTTDTLCTLFVLIEPSSGGCSALSADCCQFTTQILHQDFWSHSCHDSYRQGHGAASRSASSPVKQHDHGTYTPTHTDSNWLCDVSLIMLNFSSESFLSFSVLLRS